MSQGIVDETWFLLNSFLCGIILMLSYDIIRIFRRLVKHNVLAVAVEDFAYWTAAGIYIFILFFKENDGVVRGFSLISLVCGILFYLLLISRYLVKYITKVLNFFINLIIKIIKIILKPIYIVVKFILKRLKVIRKRVVKGINRLKLIIKKI